MAGLVPFHKRGTSLYSRGFDNFYNMLDNFFNDEFFSRTGFASDTFKIDVAQNEKEYLVEADLPGVKKEEISIDMRDGTLTVFVTREENKEDKSKNYIHKERSYCSMSRSIYLHDAEEENIKAKFENGTLSILVPKSEKKASRRNIVIE